MSTAPPETTNQAVAALLRMYIDFDAGSGPLLSFLKQFPLPKHYETYASWCLAVHQELWYIYLDVDMRCADEEEEEPIKAQHSLVLEASRYPPIVLFTTQPMSSTQATEPQFKRTRYEVEQIYEEKDRKEYADILIRLFNHSHSRMGTNYLEKDSTIVAELVDLRNSPLYDSKAYGDLYKELWTKVCNRSAITFREVKDLCIAIGNAD